MADTSLRFPRARGTGFRPLLRHGSDYGFQLLCDQFPAIGPFVQHWNPVKRCRPDLPSQPPSDLAQLCDRLADRALVPAVVSPGRGFPDHRRHGAHRVSSAGLVRTHRSWLANTRHVRSITPAGSGDCRLDLGQNVIVPLSRRYPSVLVSLKGWRVVDLW
ncbi:LytTR family DNA-binding domain-containing protein [Glacieibacterium megasporae]|uniref:LytTR family DNA-binding domain-containing protein n=1 Tax=Glacieibacterium megasporae TaxID=2835787 RepID=UPI0034E1F871